MKLNVYKEIDNKEEGWGKVGNQPENN